MPLDIAAMASPPSRGSNPRTSSNYPKLDPRTWLGKIENYRVNRARKKEVDREARELDKMVRAGRAELLVAMGDSPIANCGQLTLICKRGEPSAACLTLADGSKVLWADVKSITLADGRRIQAEHVATLFGGREGSTEIDVAG